MLTYFISDLHLDPSRPALKEILLRFLASRARQASALYILGDLFEAWVGDDAADTEADQVAEALRALAESGAAIYFISGNRDFLLGRDYAARCGMRRLPDPSVVDLNGCATLLTHGDLLCTSDTAYQSFRRQVRDPDWQAMFLAQPIAARRAYAAQARAASAEHQRGVSAVITDVDVDAVEAQLAYFGVERMIHGHTHRPADHVHSVSDRSCQRIVLADWRECGETLAVSAQGLTRVPLS
jgi:UDP-2,3-diacylglucosamine hydrolase